MSNDQQPRKEIVVKRVPLAELVPHPLNPKDITPKELERLKLSFLKNGDFGVIVINEKNQVLSGNQRVEALRELEAEGKFFSPDDTEHLIDCKQVVGATEYEQKRIVLEGNAARGSYDMRKLQEFLEGTDLEASDFNISARLFKQTLNGGEDGDEEDTFGEEDAIQIADLLPLTVAVEEDEWHAFQSLKKRMGIADDHVAIQKLLANYLRETDYPQEQGDEVPDEEIPEPEDE